MTHFENYDIRAWLDDCLSRHPRTAAHHPRERRPQQSVIKNLLLPVVSAACVLTGPPAFTINSSISRIGTLSVQEESHHIESADPIYWLGTVRVKPPVSDFNGCVMEVCRQIQAGKIMDTPTRTLELAEAIHRRGLVAQPSPGDHWIADLAKSVANLND